jgi:hypothetical protein
MACAKNRKEDGKGNADIGMIDSSQKRQGKRNNEKQDIS